MHCYVSRFGSNYLFFVNIDIVMLSATQTLGALFVYFFLEMVVKYSTNNSLIRFWHIRKTIGLTQAESAKHCYVTRQTISAIENNKYAPTLQLAFALTLLNC